jgi:hypothetical protein
MAAVVYTLCFLTAIGCAAGLLHAWARSRTPLLLWSAVCFAGLAVNEALVICDVYIFPDVPLFVWRCAVGLAALALMLAGLILHAPREGA